ncbi:MAG: hypothetical protein EHM73_14520 [Chroococcales cyanobacterium metabat2.561]|nr:MAG: hypothetical protein EHM73_14520 [Chroococcales cyanobacterium metabat2.561]
MDNEECESYTAYKKTLEKFDHNGVKVPVYKIEQSGNDFDGFEAYVTGILSNKLEFIFQHETDGTGVFTILTHSGAQLRRVEFDLAEIGLGWGTVLRNYLITTLDFNF